MSGKTKFNTDWSRDRPWLHSVKCDKHSAFCAACNVTISVSGGGISQVKAHERTGRHTKAAESFKNQSTFSNNGKSSLTLSRKELPSNFTSEENVLNAEVLQALSIVDKTQSFSSADGDNEKFQRMFPDSAIAKAYKQGRTKVKYTVHFGIAPHVKALLLEEVRNVPFAFKFDETTTSQVKKQYDGYITYYSNSKKEITTSYCGSLFLDHCSAADLINHFFHFIEDLELDVNNLLNIGMDGPSVNKKFERELLEELENSNISKFITIGSCALHTVNNAFGKGLKQLKAAEIDLDQFAIDLHFFFKLSSARREDFRKISSITDVTVHYLLKHCQTRWLSIERVLVRIIEQFENIREYFLVELPKQSGFKGKTGVGSTERYKRISTLLNNKVLFPCMTFVVFVSQDFRKFMLPLQTSAPMIHVLHSMEMKLIQNMISKFLDPKYIKNEEQTQFLSVKGIKKLDVKAKEKHLVSIPIVQISIWGYISNPLSLKEGVSWFLMSLFTSDVKREKNKAKEIEV